MELDLNNIDELKKKLIAFEERMSNLYKEGKIKAPVHLAKGNEEKLIEIFKHIKKDDWVFCSYRNHYHALLKGISAEWLEQEIVDGRSMHFMNKEHNFYTSSIVPGHLPIALGTALALKLKNSPNHVWAFCGDMASETGTFHEVTKYAKGHNLPITFIVEDDSLSVYTPTKEVWKTSSFSVNDSNLNAYSMGTNSKTNFEIKDNEKPLMMRYSYERGWPHHGIGLWVEFPEDKKIAKDLLTYKDEIKKAMELLAQDERVIFLGQTVEYKGSTIWGSVKDLPKEKRIELPILEEVQMGMSIGLALEGFIPVSVYPRMDFMILATNQLVNHLDKAKELSKGQFNPKVIIRTLLGSKDPLYPGPQHCQDHTSAYKLMLTNVDVIKLDRIKNIVQTYKDALENDKSSLIIEAASLRGKD